MSKISGAYKAFLTILELQSNANGKYPRYVACILVQLTAIMPTQTI